MKVILLITCLLLTGCTATLLPNQPLSLELQKLSAVSSKKLQLKIVHKNDKKPVGYQYLLLILPFGKIYIPQPQAHLRNTLYHYLGLADYQILPADSRTDLPLLTLQISDIRLNAYDLLFTRYIVAQVKAEAACFNPKRATNKVIQLSCSSSSYRRFAFQSELDQTLQECLKELANEVLDHAIW